MRRMGFWLAALMLILGACSSGGGAPAPTSAPATGAPAVTTTTAPPLIPQASPLTAADTLLRAWNAGDRALASRVATPAVVAAVFGRPPVSYSDRGCQDPVGGQSSCA